MAAVELPSLEQRISWFEDWEEQTRANRELARTDRDYYDGKQWTREELEELKARNQPPLVKNYIARKINFIRGEEIRKRVDPAARPRTPQHEDAARAATDALRYAEEEQDTDQVRSAVLGNMLVEGMGGALKSVEQDDDGGYRHVATHIQWDRLFHDPHSRALDFSDARYMGVVAWMDIEDAVEAYPDSGDALRAALTRDIGGSGDSTDDVPRVWANKNRKRVKIVEMYFRVGRDWYRADFTQGADLLEPEQTAILDEKGRHSVCPLVLASCYVDQEGNRYGVVRHLVSPQDEINKRASKALHLLSVRQVLAERDFVRDPQLLLSELAKPNGFIELEAGALHENRVQISQTSDLAQGHVMMMQDAKADINAVGPSSSTMPDLPESASGRAFIARQQAASQELGPVFDSLRAFTRRMTELDWLCIRQFWTEEKWLRVTDDQELNGYRWVALNRQMTRAERLQELLGKQPAPSLQKAVELAAAESAPIVMMQAQQVMQQMGPQAQGPQAEQALVSLVMRHPLMQEQIVTNQVEEMLVDIVLDESPETAVLAQEEFQTLTELLPTIVQTRPDMAPTMARLVIKASQLPNKRELLEELDKGPTPEQQQAQQQAQALQAEQAKAGLAVTQSQAQLNAAKAAQAQADAQATMPRAAAEIEANKAKAMNAAADAGQKTVPQSRFSLSTPTASSSMLLRRM